ncbi:MAG: rhodanese-like domain-containing protein, partial [Thermoanaerobaculia bacterium]|nr:rhodanese-like domain-containing protein [Thermoanaerobaculia bacterium]
MFNFLRKLFGPKADFKALAQNGAIILDVRTPEEFNSGHVEGALNIPVQILQGKIADLKKKGKPIIAVCRSGARSGMAVGMLKNAGIEAYNGGPWNTLK